MNENTALTPEQQYTVDQTVATMRILGMEPPEELIEDLRRIAAGEKTVEEYIKKLDERYKKNKRYWTLTISDHEERRHSHG